MLTRKAGAMEEVGNDEPSVDAAGRRWTHGTHNRSGVTADVALTVIGWLLVIAFSALTVVPGLSSGKVFLGTELMTHFAPWMTSVGHQEVTNVGIGDTIDSATPMAELIVRSTKDGSFPQWDPFNNGGGELGALPNAAVFSPLSLPWWFLPASSATAGVKLLEIAAIGLGMHLLMRRQWHLPAFTAPLSTLVFVASGFMLAWTNWPQTRVAAMIPLLFWASDRLATRHRWSDTLPLGLVVASMLLGGFPAITGYAIYAAALYFLFRIIATRTPWATIGMSVLRSAAGIVLGVALSAFQIFPFAWFATHYVDFEARSGFRGSHLPSVTLATSVVPSLLGLPDQTHGSWPVHFIEGFSYIGAASLPLILAALFIRPRTPSPRVVLPFFAGLLLVCGSAVYFGGPALSILQSLPGVATSPIGRLRVILGFAAAVLTGLGAAAVFEPVPFARQLRQLPAGSWRAALSVVIRLTAAGLVLVPVLLSVRDAVNDAEVLYSQKWILVAALLMIAVGLAGLFTWVTPSRASGFLAVVVILGATAVPATYVAHKWWPLSDVSSFYPETATHQYLQENLGEDRYATVGQTMLPGTSSFYGLRSVTGHGFTSPSWRELLTQVDPAFYQTPTYTTLTPANLSSSIGSPILDRLAVKYVVQAPTAEIPGETEALPGAVGQTVLSSSSSTTSPVFTGPARGIQVSVLGQSGIPDSPALLTARAVSPDGTVLATTSTVISGIDARQDVALQLEDLGATQPWTVELSLSGSGATITLATTDRGSFVSAPVRPADDGLHIVHTGDSTVIERTHALDRIRWASRAEVETDPQERLAILSSGDTDADTVILEHEADDAPATDSTAEVTVSDTDTDTISATVTSTGAGWVVIADPLRGGGWTATVDGRTTELVDADHAGVAVRVSDAGTHTIVLEYRAPMTRAGGLVTGITLLLLLVGGIIRGISVLRARGRGRPDGGSGPTAHPYGRTAPEPATAPTDLVTVGATGTGTAGGHRDGADSGSPDRADADDPSDGNAGPCPS